MRHLVVAFVLLLAPYVYAADCTWDAPVVVGTVDASAPPALNEASGLVQSRHSVDVFWSHQDNANDERLFALHRDGRYLATYDLAVPAARDPEDIAIGPWGDDATPHIYYGDIGHNDGIWGCKSTGVGCSACPAGKNCTERNPRVWVLPEPVVSPDQSYAQVLNHPAVTLEFTYPDVMLGKNQDVETLLVDTNGDLYLITKRLGTNNMLFRAAAPLGSGVLELVRTIPHTNMGGDISLDGKMIALMRDGSNDVVIIWPRNEGQTIGEAFDNEPCVISEPDHGQTEAVAFATDNTGSFFTISEGGGARPIYSTVRSGPEMVFAVAWDVVDHPSLGYYEVGVGIAPTDYTSITNVGADVEYSLPGLTCKEYYVNVRSCNNVDGACSEWDGEIHGYPTYAGDLCDSAPPTPSNLRRTDVGAGQGG